MEKNMTNTTKNWQKIKLGEVCALIKGVTYKSEDYATIDDGLVFLTLKSIAKGGGFNFDGVKYYKGATITDQYVAPNDLIIANTDLTRAGDVIGAPLFIPQIGNQKQYVFSMDITKIVADESKLNRNYLYHYLLTSKIRNYMKGISNGSTVLHLKIKLVNDLDIPLPPVELQIKIAQILSDLDAQIRYTDQIIQKTEILKQGLMRELLTKGIGHKKFKKTKIGEIPEEWDIRQLNEITFNITDGKHGDCNNESNSGYYFVSVKDIRNGQINYQGARQITRSDFEETHKRTKLEAGDLLLTNSGTIGRMAVVQESKYTEKTTFQKSVAVIKPDVTQVNVYYLMYSLTLVLMSLITESSGSAQKNLLLKDLRTYKILLPSLKEQTQICEVLGGIDSKLIKERLDMKYLISLKNGLMQDIFNQKVEVKS